MTKENEIIRREKSIEKKELIMIMIEVASLLVGLIHLFLYLF